MDKPVDTNDTCMALYKIPLYTFKDGSCILFFYRGCVGRSRNIFTTEKSRNIFRTEKECKKACEKDYIEETLGIAKRCLDKPGGTGTCRARILYYTFKDGSCVREGFHKKINPQGTYKKICP